MRLNHYSPFPILKVQSNILNKIEYVYCTEKRRKRKSNVYLQEFCLMKLVSQNHYCYNQLSRHKLHSQCCLEQIACFPLQQNSTAKENDEAYQSTILN